MKKESISTFSEGLNYDLNPLVTPNNLLTDSVNGTFITFNGNELSLQNDSGNIVISVPPSGDVPEFSLQETYNYGDKVAVTDNTNRLRYYICVHEDPISGIAPTDDGTNWLEDVVRLSPGFYPIAVKEFGGVLYIISRKQIGGTPNPEVDLIEFGSFPSPQQYTQSSPVESGDKYLTEEDVENPEVINEEIFRPGEYTSFITDLNDVNIDYDYLTLKDGIKKFYKLKIYQQLTTGYLDLTEDIETKYTGGQNHWILDNNFIYSCPNLYKGKLVWKLEIEDLENFRIETYPTVEYDVTTNLFTIQFTVFSEFGLHPNTIKVDGLNVTAVVNGTNITTINTGVSSESPSSSISSSESISMSISSSPSSSISSSISSSTSPSSSISSSLSLGQSESSSYSSSISSSPSLESYEGTDTYIATVIITVDGSNVNNILSYTVTPQYTWNGYSSGDENSLPQVYTDKYILSGKVVLTNTYSNVMFPLDISLLYSDNNICDVDHLGYKLYNELVLTDGSGIPLDNNLDVSNTNKYVIISEETSEPTGTNIKLATYTIAEDGHITISPSNWDPIITDENVKLTITNAILNTIVRVPDNSCQFVELTINIAGESASITIDQPEFDINEIYLGTSQTFNVVPNSPINITITPVDHSYNIITDNITITSDTQYTYALIAKLVSYANGSDPFIVLWDNVIDLLEPQLTVNLTGVSPLTLIGTLSLWNRLGGIDRNIFTERKYGDIYTFSFNTLTYTFISGSELVGLYKNITNNDDYIEIEGVIFKKTGAVINLPTLNS